MALTFENLEGKQTKLCSGFISYVYYGADVWEFLERCGGSDAQGSSAFSAWGPQKKNVKSHHMVASQGKFIMELTIENLFSSAGVSSSALTIEFFFLHSCFGRSQQLCADGWDFLGILFFFGIFVWAGVSSSALRCCACLQGSFWGNKSEKWWYNGFIYQLYSCSTMALYIKFTRALTFENAR